MRLRAAILLAIFSFLTIGCAVRLQPAAQGEWANFDNPKHKVSKDAAAETEKPAER